MQNIPYFFILAYGIKGGDSRPYYFSEEELEGYDTVDVVERTEYDKVNGDLEDMRGQRDAAIMRAEDAEAAAIEAKEKYANAFFTTPSRIKEEMEQHVKDDGRPKSFAELFEMREVGF